MKKYILAAAAVCAAFVASADDYNFITIDMGDKVLSLPISAVNAVTFTADDQTTSEADYELRVLTFEDADYRGDGNYLGFKDWSSLIDSPQYGGELLYGDYDGTDYFWYDDNNTGLFSAIDPDGNGFVYWIGGEAISNYVNNDYATTNVPYTEQLSVPVGPHSGTNFCMHYGYFAETATRVPDGGILFADQQPRVIDHMYVALPSYGLSVGLLGDGMGGSPMSDTDWVKFQAVGVDADGEIHKTEIMMWENGQYKEGWQKWDLSDLGPVVRVQFNVCSSMTNAWGMCFPGYVAYDDVAVRFPKE